MISDLQFIRDITLKIPQDVADLTSQIAAITLHIMVRDPFESWYIKKYLFTVLFN
jgi:pentose-5-phosphate-3-epimerase